MVCVTMPIAGAWRRNDAVLPREIGDGQELTFLPKQRVGEARNVAHMDAGAHDPAAFADSLQRQRNQIADGREDDRGIERLRRHLVGTARPYGAEGPRERLGGNVSWPGKAKDGSPLPFRDLRDDMGGGAEPETELLASPAMTSDRQPIRPAHNKGASDTSSPSSPRGNVKRVRRWSTSRNPHRGYSP